MNLLEYAGVYPINPARFAIVLVEMFCLWFAFGAIGWQGPLIVFVASACATLQGYDLGLRQPR